MKDKDYKRAQDACRAGVKIICTHDNPIYYNRVGIIQSTYINWNDRYDDLDVEVIVKWLDTGTVSTFYTLNRIELYFENKCSICNIKAPHTGNDKEYICTSCKIMKELNEGQIITVSNMQS